MGLRTIHLGIVSTTYGDDWGKVQMALFYPQKKSLFHRIFHEDPYFSVSFPLTSSYWGTLNT